MLLLQVPHQQIATLRRSNYPLLVVGVEHRLRHFILACEGPVGSRSLTQRVKVDTTIRFGFLHPVLRTGTHTREEKLTVVRSMRTPVNGSNRALDRLLLNILEVVFYLFAALRFLIVLLFFIDSVNEKVAYEIEFLV